MDMTTVLLIIHNMSTTCFGQYYFWSSSGWIQLSEKITQYIVLYSVTIKVTLVNWSRYRPGVAQRLGRGIALLFHGRGTRREWVVSSTPRPRFTPGKDLVPTSQEPGWTPVAVLTGGKSRPQRDLIPDRPDRSHSLYRLSYRAHK